MVKREDGNTLFIIPCTARKARLPAGKKVPAWRLYDSVSFRAQFKYGQLKGYDILILSAKYGLVHPNDKLSIYEQRMTTGRAEELRLSVQDACKPWSKIYHACGSVYAAALPDRAKHVIPEDALPGRGIGYQRSWFLREVKRLTKEQ